MASISVLKNIKRNIIYNNAVSNNRIRPFSNFVDDKLRTIIYSVMPAIIYIKYERPTKPPGNCRERAYLLSVAVDNSVVVSGEQDEIGEHYWVEDEHTCYDPTSLLEYDKDVYYSVNGVKNVKVISHKELENLGFIQYCRRRKIADFDRDPVYFKDLDTILPFIFNSVKYRALPEYKKEIDDYLDRLGYYRKKDEKLRQDLFRKL